MDRSITLHIFYWNGCLVAEKDSSTGRPYDIHFLSFPVLFSTGNDKKWENLICHITPNDTPYKPMADATDAGSHSVSLLKSRLDAKGIFDLAQEGRLLIHGEEAKVFSDYDERCELGVSTATGQGHPQKKRKTVPNPKSAVHKSNSKMFAFDVDFVFESLDELKRNPNSWKDQCGLRGIEKGDVLVGMEVQDQVGDNKRIWYG